MVWFDVHKEYMQPVEEAREANKLEGVSAFIDFDLLK